MGPARPPAPSPYPASGYLTPPPPTPAMRSGMPTPPAAGVIGPGGGMAAPYAYSTRPSMMAPTPTYTTSVPAGTVPTVPSTMGYSPYTGSGVSVSLPRPTGYSSIRPGVIYSGGSVSTVPATIPTMPSAPTTTTMPSVPSMAGAYISTGPSAYPSTVSAPAPYPAVPLTPTPAESMARAAMTSRSVTGAPAPTSSRRKAEKKEFYEVEFENGRTTIPSFRA